MRKNYIFIALLALTVAAIAWAKPGDLSATSTSIQSFEVTCAATATPIAPASGFTTYTDLRCGALGTTEIFIGGSAVTTGAGYPICTSGTTCVENAISVSVNRGFCIVAAGTETLNCIAIN